MFLQRDSADDAFVVWLERILWASLVFALGSGGVAAGFYLALESGHAVFLYDVSLISLRFSVVVLLILGALFALYSFILCPVKKNSRLHAFLYCLWYGFFSLGVFFCIIHSYVSLLYFFNHSTLAADIDFMRFVSAVIFVVGAVSSFVLRVTK
ncbi:MAG: hypothetical protein LBP61_09260 [Desulfovibrio sp.]|jgi:hypothetical protein|nr:hypothetical protein [Desulfovibrio sp.]